MFCPGLFHISHLEEHLPVLEVAHCLTQPRQSALSQLRVAHGGLGPAVQSASNNDSDNDDNMITMSDGDPSPVQSRLL